MYIEFKGDDLTGPARIGRVAFSKTGRTLYYAGKTFQSLKGTGFKAHWGFAWIAHVGPTSRRGPGDDQRP
jgi:hypothetical protein